MERTLLIVDDESLTRRALQSGIHFDALGITRVLEAGSAGTARELLKKEKIDLALIDVEMPGESGIELLAWLREEISATMPCAFLTCHASFDYARNALRLGANDYVLKPVEFEKVEALLLRMIGRMQEEKENREITDYGRIWLHERVAEGHKHEKSAMSTDEILDKTITYIEAHLSEKMSLSELARDAGLNPNYFNKLFKERTGETLNQYIIKKKMARAAELLLEGGLKSYVIAESLGYENYANFVNMFKKVYGQSPNAYQEEHLAKP